MVGRGGRWVGPVGLLATFLLWVGSIAALLAGLRANEVAGLLAHGRGGFGVGARVAHFHELAVMWCVILMGLQILALFVGVLVLRGAYRLRSAVCFAVSGGSVIVLNMMWLFGLLVWMRMYGDTR